MCCVFEFYIDGYERVRCVDAFAGVDCFGRFVRKFAVPFIQTVVEVILEYVDRLFDKL